MIYYGKGLFNFLNTGILDHLDFTVACSTSVVFIEIKIQSFLFLSIIVQKTSPEKPLLT